MQTLEAPERICVKELTWQPQKGKPVVLDHVNVTLEKGHFYGILGANGSGKTSLLRHFLRLLPSEKSVFLDGKPLEEWRQKTLAKLISYVPQNTVTEADFTVEELVLMGRAPYLGKFEEPKEKDLKEAREAMRLTNCLTFAKKSILCLSGGELQRAVTARALAQGASWIFLDEPVSHLDMRHQLELMKMMSELCKKKEVTVVMVLHDINLAARYCDKILMMKEGTLYASGDTEQVVGTKQLYMVYGLDFEKMKTADGQNYWVPSLSEEGANHGKENIDCGR